MTKERRLGLVALYGLIVVVQLLQQPGRTTFDTKLDLLVDPGRFLSGSLDLWSSQVGIGEIQNQAYGYLFPLGPLYWLGHAIAIAPWVTERLWSAALTIVAVEGTRRLALAWGGLGSGAALIAGVAYATAPRFLATVGTLTGEVLPTAVLPWVVLPLVLARRGRLAPYTGVLLSAVTVLAMGGQNATEVLAALPLPAIVLAHAVIRDDLPWRSALLWVGAVVAVSAWWLGPLLLLGKYSPPFLDYIESAANTTSVVGWVNSVRGADHWVSYVTVGGQPWWPAGYATAATSWLVVVTAVVAGLSLAGLVGRDIPNRVCLTLPVAMGLVCLVAAHGSWSGGLVAGQLRSLLDGPLAAFRNVHKVDPVIRLPLALGLGYLARDLRASAHRQLARLPRTWIPQPGPVAGWAVAVCAAGVLIAAAQPALAGELRQVPGWTSIPSPWQRAAQAIDRLPTTSRVLVLPASGFGLQVWGNTIDEPLQPLTSGSWATRDQAPLMPGGTVRLLDSIESQLQTGHGSAGLAALLARSGFTDVLLRTDLDPGASDAPSASEVEQALQQSAGMRLATSFGVPFGATRPIELWHVVAAAGADPRVVAVPQQSAVVVQGGPEALLSLLAHQLIGPDAPVLLAGQSAPSDAVPSVVTDTLQRREQAFGRVNDATSSEMATIDPYRTERAAHEYPAFDGERQTAAYYPGLTSVSATSSDGFVDVLGAVHPEEGPYSAFDSDGTTSWVSAPYSNPVGQSVSVGFPRPVHLTTIPVLLWSALGEPNVTSLTVSTDQGSRATAVPAGADQVVLAVAPGATRSLRVTVSGVDAIRGSQQVGISDVSLAGVDSSRTLVVPGVAGPSTSLSFGSQGPVRACDYPTVVCNLDQAHPGEEDVALDRTFAVQGGGTWRLEASAVARPTVATTQLLGPVRAGYQVEGSSVLGDDPVVAPAFAVDGDGLTSWVTAPGDLHPRLRLDWPDPRTLTRIRVGLGSQPDVRLPTTVVIRSGSQVRHVSVGPGSYGSFRPLRTTHVTLTFGTGPGPNLAAGEPMQISEVTIDGLQGIGYTPNPQSVTGEPCSFGPPVFVDGVRHETRVVGTLGDVLAGTPLRIRLCGSEQLDLSDGPHRIRIASTAQFQAVQAILRPTTAAPAVRLPDRRLTVASWGSSDRTVEVAPGPAAFLWVRENTNPGWVATVDGVPLTPIVIDGWMQGWRLPAGGIITVHLRFMPQRAYVTALLVGAGLAGLTVGGAVFAALRRRPAPPRRQSRRRLRREMRQSSALIALAAASALAGFGLLVGGLAGMTSWLESIAVRRVLVVVGVVGAAGWQLLAAGPSNGADLVAAIAVGLVVGPDFSDRDDPDDLRRTQ